MTSLFDQFWEVFDILGPWFDMILTILTFPWPKIDHFHPPKTIPNPFKRPIPVKPLPKYDKSVSLPFPIPNYPPRPSKWSNLTFLTHPRDQILTPRSIPDLWDPILTPKFVPGWPNPCPEQVSKLRTGHATWILLIDVSFPISRFLQQSSSNSTYRQTTEIPVNVSMQCPQATLRSSQTPCLGVCVTCLLLFPSCPSCVTPVVTANVVVSLLPPLIGVLISSAMLSTVFRVLDWASISATTSSTLCPIECGFDSSSTSLGTDRIVTAVVLIACFEVEMIVLAFYFSTSAWSTLLVTILCIFGVLELHSLGR